MRANRSGAQVSFSRTFDAGHILVSRIDCPQGAWAELSSALIRAEGVLTSSGITIALGDLLNCLPRIAAIVTRRGIEAEYDAATRSLLDAYALESTVLRTAQVGGVRPDLARTRARLEATREFTRPLRPFQLRNLARLLEMPHGADFSVPGSGKTATILAAHFILRHEGQLDRLLVVAPKNAFLSWDEEVRDCVTPSPGVDRLSSAQVVASTLGGDAEIVLISYHLLPNVLREVSAWAYRHATHVVLDESHRIKAGLEGVLASAALRLSSVAKRRDILSGTPLPLGISDLDPQMRFLWPGHRIVPVGRSAQNRDDSSRAAIKNLYVRTVKRELGLRPPRISWTEVQLEPLQREIYDALRNRAAESLRGISHLDRAALSQLGKQVIHLIEAASNPALLTRRDFQFSVEPLQILPDTRLWDLCQDYAKFEKPAKVDTALNRAREITDRGGKVVIWTSFIGNVEAITQALSDLGAVYLHGGVPSTGQSDPDSRESRILRFRTDRECRVLVANPAACGEGISLHQECHHAIYVDRTYNAAHFVQSLDRIHRLGLPDGVDTYCEILVATDTIDNRVEQRLAEKVRTMSAVLDDPELSQLVYDPEDITEDVPGGLDYQDAEDLLQHLRGGK